MRCIDSLGEKRKGSSGSGGPLQIPAKVPIPQGLCLSISLQGIVPSCLLEDL